MSAALSLPVRAEPRVANAPAPASVPVALSTRKPVVTWGTIERTVQPVAASARGADTPGDAHPMLDVRGIKGTLNKDDVHQTMDARQRALHACMQRTRRGLGWVGGQLRFAFKVDPQGRVAELRPLVSTIGHYELEQCLTQVVRETQFPKPAGRGSADFAWGMNVDPVSPQAVAKLRASAVASSLRKHKQELRKRCELPRRARLRVTAYVSASGEVLSSGAIATPAGAEAAVPCVLDQLATWRLPKQKRVGKVSFELR